MTTHDSIWQMAPISVKICSIILIIIWICATTLLIKFFMLTHKEEKRK